MTDQPLDQRLAAIRRKMAAPAPSPEQTAEWDTADRAMAERIRVGRPGVPLHHAFATLQTLRTIQWLDRAGEEPRPPCVDPIECGHEAALGQAEAAIARVVKACDSVKAAGRGHTPTTPYDKGVAKAVDWVVMRVLEAVDARLVNGGGAPVQSGPAATQATEAAMQRVIDLYERWRKEGPPPAGVSMRHWWGLRLAGLELAIRPGAAEATEAGDTCRPIEVDGETILVRGSGQFTNQEQQFAAEIVRAAKRKYAAEHPEPKEPTP